MIVNFRYHIFTITAIFAALGLGILIGSSIIGQEGLVEEQKKIINNISLDINRLKIENQDLKTGRAQLERQLLQRDQTEKDFLTLILSALLSEAEYYLIHQQIDPSLLKELEGIFTAAGVRISLASSEQELAWPEGISKIILWTAGASVQGDMMAKLTEKSGDSKVLTCRQANILELISLLLEDELSAGR